MANILFLAHRIPYPPNKGDKIRSWNFLSRLAAIHTVHAGFYIDDERDLEHILFLENTVRSLCYEQTSPIRQKIKSVSGLFKGRSLTECAYSSNKLKKYVNYLIKNNLIDCIFLFSSATATLIPKEYTGRIVTDLVDVDSEKWGAYAQSSWWPMSWIYRREAKKLAAFETEIAERSQVTILVSQDEANLFRDKNNSLAEKIFAVPNGVDTAIFDPGHYPVKSFQKCIIFTGAMDYQPNIEAVEWFCHNVWPKVFSNHADAVFIIAGGPLTPRIKRLNAINGVSALGYVQDMAATLAKATIAIAPLQTARGIQNKVLEALAMEKATVATSLANEGINAVDGQHLRIADTADEFANIVSDLLLNEDECRTLGGAGRSFVQAQFSWDISFDTLNSLLLDE